MLEMFYDFKSVQGRIETLKEITQTHALPRNFPNAEAMSDIAESIKVCLRENPKERLSAEKLLNRFRSKHFTQLVSAIADPKHF